ncbi:cell cycle control protein 50A-like isoform X1 [Cydia splendana]|uniref:cell cycle control protein 50A-like isoform X1 n=2 Tax=Cydia splendana TaxID=1100963 RepID=UPI0021245A12
MATEKSVKTLILIGFGVLVVASILVGVGIWCLAFVDVPVSKKLDWEYMLVNKCNDTEIGMPCINFTTSSTPERMGLFKCDCEFPLELEHDLQGAVTLYYELPEFDQTNTTYASSKDDQQLMGKPGDRPAESCGNYSYSNNTPIFPCGEIADSIFNDTFTLKKVVSKEQKVTLEVEYTNLVTGDTLKYKNPPEEVLKNFTRPINWGGDPETRDLPWETGTSLKGVENPAFQAWMDTSLKSKPVWRVKNKGEYEQGLPAGNYIMFIEMHYGVNRYGGPRVMILEGMYTESVRRSTAGGVCLILLGLLALALGAGYILMQRKKMGEDRRKAAYRR